VQELLVKLRSDFRGMKNLFFLIIKFHFHPNSLAAIGTSYQKLLGICVLIFFVFWALGCWLPLMTITKLMFFDDKYSVFLLLETLYVENEFLLFSLILVFGVISPLFKLEQLYRIWRRYDVQSDKVAKAFKRIDLISKWSMGDVFVVAIVVVISKTSGVLSDATVEVGLYYFIASALGAMVIGLLLKKEVAAHQTSPSPQIAQI
jgi:paraquat-inducible protein A